MKKVVITLAILLVIVASGQAQEKLKVGDMKNGKLIITGQKALNAYLMNSLNKSGTLGKDYTTSLAPERNRIFLEFPVSGNDKNVSNIGILLVIINNEVFIVKNTPETESSGPGAGGSFEVQCMGSCPTCMPNIKWVGGSWLPVVFCDCTQGNEGNCTMITKVVIQISAGY